MKKILVLPLILFILLNFCINIYAASDSHERDVNLGKDMNDMFNNSLSSTITLTETTEANSYQLGVIAALILTGLIIFVSVILFPRLFVSIIKKFI